MSRVVSLLIGFVCALLFVNVYGQGKAYSILSPDGSYKHDSALAFTKILKKLKDFTLPSGDAMLEKWIAAIKAANKLYNAGDLKGLGQVSKAFVSVLRGILPAIPDKNVYAVIEDLADKFAAELDSSVAAGSATLADMDKYFIYAAEKMLLAMSKGTPTAETLA